MESSETEEKEILSVGMWNRAYWAGVFLIVSSILFLVWSFLPVIWEESRYYLEKNKPVTVVTQKEADALPAGSTEEKNILKPVDENFGIVIPKIQANAKVIADVDPNNSVEYQKALSMGVAQAKGSVDPGEEGNIFIFSHSGVDFYEANRYNAVFYLLDKLEKGDEILLFYQGRKISYAVREKKVVGSEEVRYMDSKPGERIVTLMTCWPAGTEFKRLIVIAEQIEG
jgi:LPXTG-site transpeptidase (sortase) family protein